MSRAMLQHGMQQDLVLTLRHILRMRHAVFPQEGKAGGLLPFTPTPTPNAGVTTPQASEIAAPSQATTEQQPANTSGMLAEAVARLLRTAATRTGAVVTIQSIESSDDQVREASCMHA